jgi:hypothetical protein
VEVLDLTRRPGLYIQGSDTFPWGSRLTVDTLEYIIFFGHVVVPEPSTWWGWVLLLAQSSRPRLGRAMVWSHAQLLYHATKDSHVGTASSYGSKGYPCFRVLTVSITEILELYFWMEGVVFKKELCMQFLYLNHVFKINSFFACVTFILCNIFLCI